MREQRKTVFQDELFVMIQTAIKKTVRNCFKQEIGIYRAHEIVLKLILRHMQVLRLPRNPRMD